MRKKRFLQLVIQSIAVLSCLLLVTGFSLALNNILAPPKQQPPTTQKDSQTKKIPKTGLLVGLGDSLTRGIGDEKGIGYLGLVRQQLLEKNSSVQITNLAISGQTSSQLVEQLKQPQVQNQLAGAEWITLTIGGNDLKNNIEGFEKLDTTKVEKSREAFTNHLKEILTSIRTQNPESPIFLFSLYNPYGDLEESQLTSQTVMKWNETIQSASSAFPEVIVIPTYDLFQLQPSKYLASDHFHPNHLGHQRFAARLMQVIQDNNQE